MSDSSSTRQSQILLVVYSDRHSMTKFEIDSSLAPHRTNQSQKSVVRIIRNSKNDFGTSSFGFAETKKRTEIE